MGFFEKIFSNKTQKIKQDNSLVQQMGTVFIMHLLFEEKCDMPAKELMCGSMDKHVGENECFGYSDSTASFAVKKYSTQFKDGAVPPMLMITGCTEITDWHPDTITMSQMWDCPIKSGETIDGIRDGRICRDVQWRCQYENALIQPSRQVIDINMGEYASGRR